MVILSHPDEVSGTYILEDGRKIYWTEGRSSSVLVCWPGGSYERVWPNDPKHPVWSIPVIKDGPKPEDVCRSMTKNEEKEWSEWYNFNIV